jgi:hypothetical protein
LTLAQSASAPGPRHPATSALGAAAADLGSSTAEAAHPVLVLAPCSRAAQEPHGRATQTEPRIGYGTTMSDVARRFELLGRAASAGRFELADYELGEIEEQFEETLPHAEPPREGHPEVLPALVTAFLRTSVPDLRHALSAHDHAQVVAAFERTATACNGCHRASGHGFIAVPVVAGHSTPSTDPVVPSPASP